MPPHPGHSQIEILVVWKVTLHEKSTRCCTSDYRDFNSMPRKPRRDLLLSVFLGPLGDPVPEPNFPPSNVRSLATSLVHVQALLLPPPSGKDGVLLWWLVHRICSRRARGIVVIFELVRHNEKAERDCLSEYGGEKEPLLSLLSRKELGSVLSFLQIIDF